MFLIIIISFKHYLLQKLTELSEAEKNNEGKVLNLLASLYGAWSLDKQMSILYQGKITNFNLKR